MPRRVGAGAYLISVQKGESQVVHEKQVKRHVEDIYIYGASLGLCIIGKEVCIGTG